MYPSKNLHPSRARYISAREADDQYAVPEPDDTRDHRESRREWSSRRDSDDRGEKRYERDRHERKAPTLNATTEDEMIVKGDLPPQSFGAFSAPATANSGYFKKATAEVKIAGLSKDFVEKFWLRPPKLNF